MVPPGGFFFRDGGGAEFEQLLEMEVEVGIAAALAEEVEVLGDEAGSALEQGSDFTGGQSFVVELGATHKGGEVIGDRRGRVVKDAADLGGGLALEGQADDLDAMGEGRSKVVDGAAHRNEALGLLLAQLGQIAGDGAWGDEEDAEGQVLGGQEGALAEGLFAEVAEACLAETGRSVVVQEPVVLGAAMDGEVDGFLAAIHDGFSGRFFGIDGDEADRTWRSHWTAGLEEGEIDFPDDVTDGVGFEGRAIQSVDQFSAKAGVEGFRFKAFDGFASALSPSHGEDLLDINPLQNSW
jgi:hypothetical protein